MRLRAVALLLVLPLAVACRPRAAAGGGTVSVEWTAGDSALGPGAWRGPGEAAWCDSTGQLAVFAVRNDTGVALLVKSGKPVPGSYPLMTAPDGVTPQWAVAALRWYGGARVVALTAHTGRLELASATPRATGTFDAVAAAPDGEDSVTFRGTLQDVPVRTGADGCRVAGSGVP